MIVMKFGGTSVGIPENFRVAIRLVEERRERDPLVVVSALAGVTNLLVEWCRSPAERVALAARLVERHVSHAREVGIAPDILEPLLGEWRDEAGRRGGRPGTIAGEERDRILAFGEGFAATLFAAALRARGTAARALDGVLG